MPYASIIVPAFNAQATVRATLTSLTAQSHADLEIIVVDDGSTDDTAVLAQQVAATDPRIKVVRQANRGLAGARNSGLAVAQGAVIGFCDATDLWMPDKLATHVAHLRAAPEVGLSYSGAREIDGQGMATGRTLRPRLRGITPAHMFKRDPVGGCSTPVIRRAALDALGWRPRFERQRDWIFDESVRQAGVFDCWLRLSLSTDWEIAGVPGLLTCLRAPAEGMTLDTRARLASWDRVVTRLRSQSPAFFDRHEPAARAFQMVSLARCAIAAGDGATARALIRNALRISAAPLREDPVTIATTWVAAQALDRMGPRALSRAKDLRPLSSVCVERRH